MRAGNQSIAPMSRFLGNNANECDFVSNDRGQGCNVALDGLAISVEDENEAAGPGECNTLRYTGFMEVLDENGIPGLDNGAGGACPGCVDGPDGDGTLYHYEFSDWRDVLAHHLRRPARAPPQRCLPRSDPGPLGHDDPLLQQRRAPHAGQPLGQHVPGRRRVRLDRPRRVRRAEARLPPRRRLGHHRGLPRAARVPAFNSGSRPNIQPQRTFCNGLEEEEDDPIRRPCDLQGGLSGYQQVCNSVPAALRSQKIVTNPNPTFSYAPTVSQWWLGPAAAPPAGSVGDLGLVVAMMIPPTTDTQDPYAGRRCSNLGPTGSVSAAIMPSTALPQAQRLCPNGEQYRFGACKWPVVQGSNPPNFACIANRGNRAAQGFSTIDGRGYNLIPRKADGTFMTVDRVNPNTDAVYTRSIFFAAYRMHETAVLTGGTYTTPPVPPTAHLGAGTSVDGVGCQETDATDRSAAWSARAPAASASPASRHSRSTPSRRRRLHCARPSAGLATTASTTTRTARSTSSPST